MKNQILKLGRIREMLHDKKIKWTAHSMERLGERDISIKDVKNSIETGEIIEEYPDDYPYPSCLILGMASNRRKIHVVVGSDDDYIYIITAYYPDALIFGEDFKTRRK